MNIVEYFELHKREVDEQLDAIESGRVPTQIAIAAVKQGLLACGRELEAHQLQPVAEIHAGKRSVSACWTPATALYRRDAGGFSAVACRAIFFHSS
jgi:hypothetical protein